MLTNSKSLVIFTLFVVLWLENKAHRCGSRHENIRSSGKRLQNRKHQHQQQQRQSKLAANATLEPCPHVNVTRTLTAFIIRCQKVESAKTCLSVCQQHHPTTTSWKRIVTKRREPYAASILIANPSMLVTTSSPERHRHRHSKHQTYSYSGKM